MNTDEQRTQLFRHLWRGGNYSFYWTMPGRRSWWFEVGRIPRVLRDIRKNVYFGVHPVTAIPETNARGGPSDIHYVRSQNAYIAAINCLYAEFDGDKGAALMAAYTVTPPPTVIIDSGGGYHLYWLFDKPLILADDETRDYARKLQWRWVKHISGADQGAKDLSRVLRVPGSRNYKEKYAPDYPRVEFVRWLNVEYSLQELVMRLPQEPVQRRRPRQRTNGDGDGERVLRTAERMIDQAADGEKHTRLLQAARLAGGAVGAGMLTEAEAERVLEQAIREKPGVDSVSGALATLRAGLTYGKEAPL